MEAINCSRDGAIQPHDEEKYRKGEPLQAITQASGSYASAGH